LSERAHKRGSDGQRLAVILVLVLVATFYAVDLLVAEFVAPEDLLVRVVAQLAILVVVTGGLLWGLLIRPLQRAAEDERALAAEREVQLLHDGRRQEWQGRLHKAMEMALTEAAAHRVVQRVLRSVAPTGCSELLVADASDAHLERVVVVETPEPRVGCGVASPAECPAVRRAQPQVFPDSEAFDACPHLHDRPTGNVSAVCVPVNIMGKSVGVFHVQGPVGRPPEYAVPNLEILADNAGARIGMLRVMERTSLQAATDPLTGLLNRRSLEGRARELVHSGLSFSLAMGDLDLFKQLNDVHGHEVGDRALRLFAQTMQSAVRDDDLVCRFGGEEFVVVFPGAGAEVAARALDRVREELLVAVARGTVPGFTVSFGLATSSGAEPLDDVLRRADMALLQAKRDGRDRVVIASA
jgi:diguanylate cyclase (GGDEF)-like protein